MSTFRVPIRVRSLNKGRRGQGSDVIMRSSGLRGLLDHGLHSGSSRQLHCSWLRSVSWLPSDDGICFTVMLTGMEPSLLGQLSVLWAFVGFDPHRYCCFQAMTLDAFNLEGK